MMKKRGAGNVEFILSFMLFISFTVAALYFFNPVRGVQNLESSKNYVVNTIIANTSVSLEAYSIIISASSNILSIEVSLPESKIPIGKNVRVVDYYGNVLSSNRNGNQVCFTRENDEKFATIYFSEDLKGDSAPCAGSADYQVASSISSKVLSEKRIMQLNNSYYGDYSSLKEQFNIPANMDFSFSFEFQNGKVISVERNAPLRKEVFSETKIKEILKEDGTSEFGYLTVRVW